jgi:hypothetical protein
MPDSSVGAAVTNLPFGRQFEVPGSMTAWLSRALAEPAWVVRGGGRVVVLAPDIPAGAVPPGLTVRRRDPLRLLGTATTLWVFDVADAGRRADHCGHSPRPRNATGRTARTGRQLARTTSSNG